MDVLTSPLEEPDWRSAAEKLLDQARAVNIFSNLLFVGAAVAALCMINVSEWGYTPAAVSSALIFVGLMVKIIAQLIHIRAALHGKNNFP